VTQIVTSFPSVTESLQSLPPIMYYQSYKDRFKNSFSDNLNGLFAPEVNGRTTFFFDTCDVFKSSVDAIALFFKLHVHVG